MQNNVNQFPLLALHSKCAVSISRGYERNVRQVRGIEPPPLGTHTNKIMKHQQDRIGVSASFQVYICLRNRFAVVLRIVLNHLSSSHFRFRFAESNPRIPFLAAQRRWYSVRSVFHFEGIIEYFPILFESWLGHFVSISQSWIFRLASWGKDRIRTIAQFS